MSQYWLVVGAPENWRTAFQHKNIWGLKRTQRHLWDSLNEKDMLLFYVTSPVSGVVGHGTIRTKFHQDQPLWPQEVEEKRVIWPLRFEFDVERCLPIDEWLTSKIGSSALFPRGGFQALSYELGRQVVSKLKSLPKGYRVKPEASLSASETPPLYAEAAQQVEQVSPSHNQIKQLLVEIGRLQGYLADEEYVFDIGKLDVVWRRVERSVPTYAFEVQVGGDVYHALAKLKHAYDLWNSRIFIVASRASHDKVANLLSGTFHEISGRIRFIDLGTVEELHRRKRAYLDFERELGI